MTDLVNNWGLEYQIDGSHCNDSIMNAEAIRRFSDALVKKIDMVPYGEPMIMHFGTGSRAGITLLQLIETSNIACHFVDETKAMHLTVFSCKEFKHEDVKEMVMEYFKPEHIADRSFWRSHIV